MRKKIFIILACCTIICIPIILLILLIKWTCNAYDRYSYKRKVKKIIKGTYHPFVSKRKYRFVNIEIVLFFSITAYSLVASRFNFTPNYVYNILGTVFCLILVLWLFRLFDWLYHWLIHHIRCLFSPRNKQENAFNTIGQL